MSIDSFCSIFPFLLKSNYFQAILLYINLNLKKYIKTELQLLFIFTKQYLIDPEHSVCPGKKYDVTREANFFESFFTTREKIQVSPLIFITKEMLT